MFGRKTDRECAAIAVAAAIVAPGEKTKDQLRQTLTRDEMERARDYLASGKPIGRR
ncbi:hypothetical protein [Streptomyces sp. NPDC092952]|uniref:hypothetical protein n=1 Tax=Streptomyces sp. NPDC092952 TaxID=3366018 RepID=UPI0037F3C855